MPILGSSNSAANKKNYVKNMDTIICMRKKTSWEKGEIARNEQFLLFPRCFQKLSIVDASK